MLAPWCVVVEKVPAEIDLCMSKSSGVSHRLWRRSIKLDPEYGHGSALLLRVCRDSSFHLSFTSTKAFLIAWPSLETKSSWKVVYLDSCGQPTLRRPCAIEQWTSLNDGRTFFGHHWLLERRSFWIMEFLKGDFTQNQFSIYLDGSPHSHFGAYLKER
jgi:hypothetical protein